MVRGDAYDAAGLHHLFEPEFRVLLDAEVELDVEIALVCCAHRASQDKLVARVHFFVAKMLQRKS